MVMIDHQNGQPYYAQLVAGLQQDIAHGVLQTDDQLPSVREMARQHLLNPNTVSKAYKQLEALHVIRTVQGKGSYVNPPDRTAERETIQQNLQQLVQQAQQVGVPIADLITWLTELEETSS
ncbi:GntR family transcriptional regulator [Lactobacillus sp. CBA3605]|uniref:GntR family transcriptional regulator n=1 Tax=Lactobacillus sp. CBA3605 TaxID=2099788 RepID=UPI000CFBFA9B|nr:GntR family transcriptional regulator [Lactobacillus sp. CBA3605]AVK61746.1 GntR family transcriptional regulator [Lactobacillus sp. CBA3605]